ncbi:isochorismatase family protein [Stieleria marina]|uniref:Putative isochorismatase n=1 Tax=Stieleria marina TaxID=1930275 RepID=A0A517NQC1_9BACT|nr:putative isochorismatase [Planctomycetes bacterium K23_9]
MPHVRSPLRLHAERSAVLVIDLQQKLVPVIPGGDQLVAIAERLRQASQLLGVPNAATVQYPKGLGGLVSPLAERFPNAEEKLDFSSAVCRGALAQWATEGRDQIVLVGIETHVCVQQTALDLLAEGLRPVIPVDAVGARRELDHDIALQRMRDCGVILTTTESILFEWLSTADRPEFKAVSQLVKSS